MTTSMSFYHSVKKDFLNEDSEESDSKRNTFDRVTAVKMN